MEYPQWHAMVRMNQGTLVQVSVLAPDANTALTMFERLYGSGSVSIGPWRS